MSHRLLLIYIVVLAATTTASSSISSALSSPTKKLRISGHVPHSALVQSHHIGRSPDREMTLSFSLAFRDEEGMKNLIARQTDPKDPLFGKYLSPKEVLDRFGPTTNDISIVKNHLTNLGLKISGQVGNLIFAKANTRKVETIFAIEIDDFQTSSGEQAFSTNLDPQVSIELSDRVYAIAGLETLVKSHSHAKFKSANSNAGSGPNGGFTPADINKAYGISASGVTGTGQVLALYELDGYKASDISAYEQLYKISPAPALQNILVDGFNGSAGSGAGEVTLDIELMAAVAPGVSKILVYEGPNSQQGAIDTYARIANDNLARQVSSSWGLDETTGAAVLKSENAIFMQMALQGQSMFAASGDSGAYDNGSTLSVDDPASQPYVTGVGGTTLTLNSDGTYKSESSWNVPASGQQPAGGGGGGISSVWPIPAWQSGLGNAANKGSQTMRMVPDVSLNANLNTGYTVVINGQSTTVGGTSCAAPIWAAMAALANQQRANNQNPPLGFANPILYQLAKGSLASQFFHDVNDGTTNFFYPAVTGYDLATGIGTANFANLFTGLINAATVPTPPTQLTATAHNTLVTLTWTASLGASSYSVYRSNSTDTTYVQIASNLTEPHYTNVGLINGNIYYYYVVAVDSAGSSQNSAVVNATPNAAAPQTPTNLTYKLVSQ